MATNAGVTAFPAYAAGVPGPATVGTRTAINPVLRAAFYLFVLSIPFEIPDRTIPIEIPTLTAAVFLLATLLQPSACYRRLPGAVLSFIAYLWVFGLSTLVNRSGHAVLVAQLFLLLFQLVLVLWVGTNLLRDKTVLRGVILALAFACAVRAGMQLLGIGATVRAVWTGGVRVTALGQNPNWSAIVLSAGLITILSIRPRLLTWPIAALTGVAVIQTGSRGGLVALAVGLLALVWQGRTIATRLRGLAAGLLALGVLAFGVLRSDMLRTRLTAAAEEGSLAGRERIYPAAISMIGERPLLGWGPIENQFEIASRIGEERKERRDAHNILLDLLSSTGLLGAIPFLFGLGLCVRSAWRARHGPYGMLPFALVATTLTGCISGTWIASKVLWLSLAIGVATGAMAWERRARLRALGELR